MNKMTKVPSSDKAATLLPFPGTLLIANSPMSTFEKDTEDGREIWLDRDGPPILQGDAVMFLGDLNYKLTFPSGKSVEFFGWKVYFKTRIYGVWVTTFKPSSGLFYELFEVYKS